MKEMLEKKIAETKEEFEKLQERKNELMTEVAKIEQEIFRLDGKYIAYQNMLKEIETEDVIQADI